MATCHHLMINLKNKSKNIYVQIKKFNFLKKQYIILKKLITLRKYQEHKDEMCD